MSSEIAVVVMPLAPVPEAVLAAAARTVLRLTSGSPGAAAAVLEALGLDDVEVPS